MLACKRANQDKIKAEGTFPVGDCCDVALSGLKPDSTQGEDERPAKTGRLLLTGATSSLQNNRQVHDSEYTESFCLEQPAFKQAPHSQQDNQAQGGPQKTFDPLTPNEPEPSVSNAAALLSADDSPSAIMPAPGSTCEIKPGIDCL